ncbi:MAG: Rpn family recombination-promoting nuclease/putative transposase, partial [Oscillospiraceae bacterium]|nr:Rpn family recombination-promoting nuclease/putative transposase [Oscillospiraceae bacterium]
MDLKKYYYLTNDAVFKKIFGSEKNRDLLISFLSAILNIPKETMSDVTVKNPEITPENIADKFCRLDLSLSIDGTDIDVEMQVGKEENFGDRLLVYWAKMYSATLGKGNNYWGLKKCISLAFVDFEMFPEHRNSPKFHYNFAVTEKDLQFPLSDKLDAQIVELRKVPNFKADENNELMWLNFLKAKSEEEIDMIGQTGTSDIQKAANAWRDFNADESNRIIAMNREFAELARNTALYNARIQGKQEGLLEGLLEGERKKAIFTAK